MSQEGIFRGYLLDQKTRSPVTNAHIRIRNSNEGEISGSDGSFSIALSSLPVNIEVTCLGYESLFMEMASVPDSFTTLLLKPISYYLETVTVSGKPSTILFKDRNFSVLDYNFLGNNLALLVFRHQLNKSEIIILTTNGDTVTVSPLPAIPPQCLYKDVFSNLHYLTRRNEAFQGVYDPALNRLTFPYRTSVDTLNRFLRGFRFFFGDRLYFQEDSPNGFLTSIGFYRHSEGRKYIRRSFDNKEMKSFYADASNYHTFRPIPEPIDANERRGVDADAYAYLHLFKKKSCGELFLTSDSLLAFFDFCQNRLELLTANGLLLNSIPIDFHLSTKMKTGLLASITTAFIGNDEWKWNKTLLQDEIQKSIYAVYTRNGFVRLKIIDLKTGLPGDSRAIPFAFPEKIRLFRGDAYFLYKETGEHANWMLGKVSL